MIISSASGRLLMMCPRDNHNIYCNLDEMD
jgi:hypothetical protein